MTKLPLAKDLSLPLDVVTQTLAILARKGSGKTFTARRLMELLFRAGMQVVDVDPKGDHWGMRSSADGKGPGLGFLILGGEHGDLPLEAGAGELVAKLVVEERVSAILDLSFFRKHELATFMTAFLEGLYRLKAREAFRTPVMLLVDEADAVAPQRPQRGEERMLGAIEDIVRRGRQRGIGCTLVTQRSAVLNKNVLTQAQVMVAMRTIAPQDLKAMDEWIDVHGTPEQRATLMESLPALPRGDAWVWSPGWPSDAGIFQRVHVDAIETFDSGATPEPGQKRVEPKQRADVDLEALRRQMAATVERAKANDPAALRRRIAELERAAAKPAPQNIPRTIPKEIKVPVLADAKLRRLDAALDKGERLAAALNREAAAARAAVDVIRATIQEARALRAGTPPAPPRAAPAPLPRRPIAPPAPARAAAARPQGDAGPEDLTPYAHGLLRTLAEREPMRLTVGQLAALSGRSARSSAFDGSMAKLRKLGLIGADGTRVTLTDAGRAAAGPVERPAATTPEEVQAAWLRVLPPYERALLQAVLAAHPRPLAREEIGAAAGKSPGSSAFDAALASLRRNGLITGGAGEITLTEELTG